MIDTRAFHIWTGLEHAKDGIHPYGGNITEIYPLHLFPDKPVDKPWEQAGKTLYAILKQFCSANNVCASVDGREIGDWMNKYKFFRKCDVKIYEGKPIIDLNEADEPIFQSKESEELFKKIENTILKDKEKHESDNEEGLCSSYVALT